MIKIYGHVNSGNCYKVKLLAEQLALPYEWISVDILQKETQSAAFLSRNPNGKIPLLEMEEGKFLPESNAILHYLADIGLFAYTHVAEEGGFALSEFLAIGKWIERVREQPCFVAIG